MKTSRQRTGSWGEAVASDFLAAQGFVILGKNVRTPYGELDLVAQKGRLIIFVEVKTRRNDHYGMPEESVTFKKQAHLRDAAEAYLLDHPELDDDWRIDVIAIRKKSNQEVPEIIWFENALA